MCELSELKTKCIASLSYVWVLLFAATLYVLVLFALSLVNYYVFFCICSRLIFKWCLFGSDSCSISSASCFRLFFHLFCSYKNLLQIPCRSQEKREFTIFLLVCLPFLSQPFGAECVSFFPFLYRHLLGDYLFLSFIFFQLKSGSKTDLCLYDFVCLHILFNICLCESDVSKGCETQNKNSVCRHFKLDLESKLKKHHCLECVRTTHTN